MLFDRPIAPETYAVIRFGLGYPARDIPLDAGAILDRLQGPDRVIQAHPLLPFVEAAGLSQKLQRARSLSRKTKDKTELNAARKSMNDAFSGTLLDEFKRAVETDDPFRERLQAFWVNHFAARANSYVFRTGHAGYAADAIRPNLTKRFADMLKAVVTHPFMLIYLDQPASMGPNSVIGKKRNDGLNENFARELLELHTLGAGAPYTQDDVRQFAELLTGMSANLKRGFFFHPGKAEPGPEQVLSNSYGGAKASVDDVFEALEDLAVHPSTAKHLAWKLAQHFIADEPDEDLVAHMAARYAASSGELLELYEAMLEHPAAWSNFGKKVKWPIDMMKTGFRALGMRAADLDEIGVRRIRKVASRPLMEMGMQYARPPGPDGWPDTETAWVNAHGLAGRIGWAMSVANKLGKKAPDPREFVYNALGDAAGVRLIQAANGAETRPEGVSLILASAEFNRR